MVADRHIEGTPDGTPPIQPEDQFWAAIRVPTPNWEPDDRSPPLNQELIHRVVYGNGTPEEIREVADLAVRFRPWWTAIQRTIVDDYDRNR